MEAMRMHGFGDASVIRHDDIAVPEPGRGQVLVRVAGSAFNNASEIALRQGRLRGVLDVELPFTPGWSIAGRVAEVGPDVASLAIGDEVVGRIDGGGAAVPLPHGAALPVAGLTAWQAVHEHARIQAGERVLVVGAGGAVGTFALQLAKLAGATVIATASALGLEVVRRLGADETIDYTAVSLRAALDEPVDVVLNLAPLPPGTAAALPELVRRGGRVLSIATPVPASSDVSTSTMTARNDPEDLEALVTLVDAGRLRIEVAERRPLHELADVHRRAEAGAVRGHVVMIPRAGRKSTTSS